MLNPMFSGNTLHKYTVNNEGKPCGTVTDHRLDLSAVKTDLITKEGYPETIYLTYEGKE